MSTGQEKRCAVCGEPGTLKEHVERGHTDGSSREHMLLYRLPKGGWSITIGVHHGDPDGVVTFRAERHGGDGAFCDALSYEQAVRFLVGIYRPELLTDERQ